MATVPFPFSPVSCAFSRQTGIRRSPLVLALLSSSALLFPVQVHAQQANAGAEATELTEIVVEGATDSASGPDKSIVAGRTLAGSKTDTAVEDISASVSVITQAEMERRGTQNLDEVLAYTSSVSADEYGSDDRYDWVRIRGFYQTSTGSYLDGLPMRISGFTGSRVEPYGLQRVEVLKGSTSTLFGLNAPGGLINSISKRPQAVKHGEVYTTLGDEHVEFGTDFGGPIDDQGIWSYRITSKWQDGNNGADHTEDDRFYIAPALTWAPTDATSLTLLPSYNKRDGNTAHGIPYGSGIDPKTYLGEPEFEAMDTIEKNIGYAFSHDFGNGLQFRQNARYTDLDLTYESVYGATADPSVSRSAWAVYGNSRRFVIDNQLQYDVSFGRFDSRSLAGMDFSYNDTDEHRVFGSASGINIYNPVYCGLSCLTLPAGYDWNQQETARGFYLQEELTFDDRWILTLGGRFDSVTTESAFPDSGLSYKADDEAFTKRIGLTYKVTDGLSVYGNYSESFQPISADRTSLVGTPKPQEGTQYEVGLKYRPANYDALFTLALFDLTQTNVPYNISTTTQSQIGETNVKGVELEGKFALTDQFNLTVAYSYWDAEIVEDGITGNQGNKPQLIPQQMASIWADYTLPGEGIFGDLTLGLGVRYTGASFADNENTLKIKPHTLVDAAVNYQIRDNVALAVNATNLFDTEYLSYVSIYDNTAFYGDGRAVRATLKYTW
ncbi:iron complex outermembrane recepter protein [Roseibium suaedae]|uniref:Iron complex outermembrane recepter protein n=1 Tax=Roseibium suaedae TaxID=735517 RepID=A0A1M6YW98_9HYPH|nr:TonB-dependent siderophore receptor [Roseibium suaedae]SHL22518.1 iron complex outermembrane recepter protein [Roseibium suaedae]